MIPGLIFLDIAVYTVSIAPTLLSLDLTISSIKFFLVAASGFSAILSIVTGSPAAYSITLALLVAAELPVSPQSGIQHLLLEAGYIRLLELGYVGGVRVPAVGIVGLFLVLVLDTYSTAYRPGKRGDSSSSFRDVLKTSTAFLAILLPFIVVSVALGVYLTSLIEFLKVFPQRVSVEFLRVFSSSLVTHVMIATVLLYILVRLLDSSVSVIAPFLIPSRKLSIETLLEKKDLDRVFTPPLLGTVLGLATLLFYPAIYVMLFDILLGFSIQLPVGLELVSRVFEHLVSLLIASYITYGLVDRRLLGNPGRKRVIRAVIVLLLLYASSVKLSIARGESLLKSIVEPDFAGLAETLESTYTNYAYYLVVFIESLSRSLGVVP